MFHFIANLKDYTFHRGKGNRRFSGYLLSADYTSDKYELSQKVLQAKKILVADNGNVDLIRELIKDFKSKAKVLDRKRKNEEKSNNLGYAKPGELSDKLTGEYQDLIKEIANKSELLTNNNYIKNALKIQTSLNPTYVIGMEDFTIATLTALSIEPEYSLLNSSDYNKFNKRAIEFYNKTKADDYGPVSCKVFAGLHAIDFDSAYEAGKLAGKNGVDGIASGFVGALQDKNHVDFYIKFGKLNELNDNVPRPYLRVVEIVAGLHLGYHEVTGMKPSFHGLGIGTPILLPLISLFSDVHTYTSVDSTSPIYDGWISPTISLYVSDPAPLKLKAYKIARYWIKEDIPWSCSCPFCKNFMDKYTHDIKSARNWWNQAGQPTITKYSLNRDKPLSKLLPILANHSSSQLQREAAMARVRHNHWVVQNLEKMANAKLKNGKLQEWVENAVSSYLSSYANKSWKRALKTAWNISREVSSQLKRSKRSKPRSQIAKF